jgi:hypothetical protein
MRTSIVVKILVVFVFASVIGGISAGPALGKNDNRGQRPQPRGYYDDRGRHDNRGWYYDNRGRRVYRPRGYYHPGPAYGPPPVFHVPIPPPGISLFFPFPFDNR